MNLWFLIGLHLGLAATVALPSFQAGKTQAGKTAERSSLLPTSQRLHPAGESLAFGGRPIDLALAPDRKTLYIKDNRGLVVVDVATWKRLQELPFPQSGGSMHGLAVSRDGKRVWATTAQRHLFEADVQPDGQLAWGRTIALPGPGGQGDSHGCGIALTSDERTAYICLSRNNTLGVVDLETGALQSQIPVGVAPWDVVLSPDGKTAYVSNWGGRRPLPGEPTAPSSGTPTLVDARGIGASGTVSFVDLATAKEIAQTATGLHPSDIQLSTDGQRLYVAGANSDTISVLDCATRRTVETISVHLDSTLPFGSAPTGLALHEDDSKLFVTLGGNNAVVVVGLRGQAAPREKQRREGKMRTSQLLGLFPTGWYPGAIVTSGPQLFVVNVKGDGTQNRSASAPGGNTNQHRGTVSRIALPSAGELRRLTAQARTDTRIAEISRARNQASKGKKPIPIPSRAGEPSVFQHIVYVIKENRTYDQVFGDLKQGNGDPKLCLYGRNVTPNHHALAETFVLLDNFYCNGVLSADGHSWATEGNVTDHLEKSFGGFTRSYTFGDDPLTYSSSGFLWDGVLRRKQTFRNYGEMDYAEPVPSSASWAAIYKDYRDKTNRITFTQKIGLESIRRHSSPNYPGWNLAIPDALRADRFLAELQAAEKSGKFPNLTILYLPQDHTSGTSPKFPTPRAMVADNDLALGRVVEGISHSRFWPTTCLFVIEDDPQDGFDHVDGHRSLCLVVSPYTRRGATVSSFYNQTSVLHTMERILGLPAMNQFDSMSPLMRECFTARADLRPYDHKANQIALDEMNPPVAALRGKAQKWARKSLALNFRKPDDADEDTFNRILWYAAKGIETPYPAHLAGAHRRGLSALGLKLAPRGSKRKNSRGKEADDD